MRRVRGATPAILVAAMVSATNAVAQTGQPDLQTAEEPAASPFQPVVDPVSSAPSIDGEGLLLHSVEIAGGEGGVAAVPPPTWTPPTDRGGAISLSHRRGQSLDREWVRAQFVPAIAEGGLRPSAAIAIVQLINRAYVGAGFINSGLLVDGIGADGQVLNLRLVMGRLAEAAGQPAMTIAFKDGHAGGLSADYVRARFAAARARPLDAFELERDFRLLDESDAIQSISAALTPGANPGEAGLNLLVTPAERFGLIVGGANNRSPSVGEHRAFAGLSVRNLLVSGDVLSGEGGLTRGVKDGQGGYSLPLFVPALSADVRASFNNAAVIASSLAPLDIKARDRGIEAGLSYKLLARPMMMRGTSKNWAASETLVAGAHWLRRHQRSYLLGEPFSFAPGSVDGRAEFEALRFSGDYLRRSQQRVIAASMSATLGLTGTRSDVPGIPNPRKNFAAYLAQFNFAQRLTESLELRGRLTGQYSNGTLYSALRLPIGGAASVRGYRETLFLVDRGVIGSVELARRFSLTGHSARLGRDIGAFAASVFIDGARFRNAEAPQPADKWIASVGAGLGWTPSRAFEASITYGHALKDVPVPGKKSLQDKGFQFRIVVHPIGLL